MNDVFLLQNVQAGFGTHPAFYSMLTVVLSAVGVGGNGEELYHSPSCRVEVKNEWRYISTPRGRDKLCLCVPLQRLRLLQNYI